MKQNIDTMTSSKAIDKAIIINDCQVDSLTMFTDLFACQPDNDKQLHILTDYHGIVPE